MYTSGDDFVAVDVAVLDFSKAFDVVSHPKLVFKLNNLGIHPLTTNWISSWLQQLDLFVYVNNVYPPLDQSHLESHNTPSSALYCLTFLLTIC